MWQYGYSDELYHWKYIKRVKKNGKWRYYYDKKQLKDDLGLDDLKEYDKAKNRYEYAEDRRIETKEAVRKFENASHDDNIHEYNYEKAHARYRDAIYWKETAAKRGSEYMSARSKLMKTPVGKIVAVKETVENGAKAVSSFFKGLRRGLTRS